MLGNMGNMMKQVADLKKQMKQLKKTTAEATSKDGMVKVLVNGELTIKNIEISDDADIKKLPKVLKETINQAFKDVKYKSAGQMKGLADLNIPGL